MEYLTPKQYGDKKGVSKKTVIRWIEKGTVTATKTPGGHYRIPYNPDFHDQLPSYSSEIQIKKLCRIHGPAAVLEYDTAGNTTTIKVRGINRATRLRMIRTFSGGMSADEGFDIGNCNACKEHKLNDGDITGNEDDDDTSIHWYADIGFKKLLEHFKQRLEDDDTDDTIGFNIGPLSLSLDKDNNITVNQLGEDFNVIAHEDIMYDDIDDNIDDDIELVDEDNNTDGIDFTNVQMTGDINVLPTSGIDLPAIYPNPSNMGTYERLEVNISDIYHAIVISFGGRGMGRQMIQNFMNIFRNQPDDKISVLLAIKLWKVFDIIYSSGHDFMLKVLVTSPKKCVVKFPKSNSEYEYNSDVPEAYFRDYPFDDIISNDMRMKMFIEIIDGSAIITAVNHI